MQWEKCPKEKMKTRTRTRVGEEERQGRTGKTTSEGSNLAGLHAAEGAWKVLDKRHKHMISDTRNAMTSTGLLAMADPDDIFHHICRDWNSELEKMTHGFREQWSSWSSYCGPPAALRLFSDGRVNNHQETHVSQFEREQG